MREELWEEDREAAMKLDANCQLYFNSHCLYSSTKQREVVMEEEEEGDGVKCKGRQLNSKPAYTVT